MRRGITWSINATYGCGCIIPRPEACSLPHFSFNPRTFVGYRFPPAWIQSYFLASSIHALPITLPAAHASSGSGEGLDCLNGRRNNIVLQPAARLPIADKISAFIPGVHHYLLKPHVSKHLFNLIDW